MSIIIENQYKKGKNMRFNKNINNIIFGFGFDAESNVSYGSRQ